MKIIFLTANPFPSYSGGIENWLYNIIRVLDSVDDIQLVIISPESDEKPFYDLSPFTHLSLVRTQRKSTTKYSVKLPRPLRLVASNMQSIKWITQSYKALCATAKKGDVVVVLHPIPGMLPAAGLKLTRRTQRVLCSVRGRIGLDLEAMGHPLVARIYKSIEKFLLRYSDAVHSNGRDTADYLLNELGVESTVVSNGVNYNQFAHPQPIFGNNTLCDIEKQRLSGIRFVATVATLRDVKGIRYIIEAAAVLKEKYANSVRFAFIGKGDPTAYKEYAHSLGVEDMMFFAGEQKEVSAFLQQIDVCVAVSGGGGVSNAAIEMMAAGKAIVAWNNMTYSQLLEHDQTGCLVDEWNSQSLAAGIETLLDDPCRAGRLGKNAQTKAADYDWSKIASAFLEIALGGCKENSK
ncbi:glycosyltransferase family 4 protein [bacterium]|nr:glycosyltransferase family 4 protein [bacterium]